MIARIKPRLRTEVDGNRDDPGRPLAVLRRRPHGPPGPRQPHEGEQRGDADDETDDDEQLLRRDRAPPEPEGLVEDRGEVGRIGIEANVVEHLQSSLGQAFQVLSVQRSGPFGVLAHHNRGLEMKLVNKDLVRKIADGFCNVSRCEISVKCVFEVCIIVMHLPRNVIAGRPGRNERHMQARRPRH